MWTRRLLPILSCADALAYETSLFHGRPDAAERAMRMAGIALGRQVYHDARAHVAMPGGRRGAGAVAAAERVNLVVLLGKGNNAGDALMAAGAFLAETPRGNGGGGDVFSAPVVNLVHCFDPQLWSGEVLRAMQFLTAAAAARRSELLQHFGDGVADDRAFAVRSSLVFDRSDEDIEAMWHRQIAAPVAGEAICVLDGVFGMQFSPPLRSASKTAIALCNSSEHVRVRFAVDVPSGVGDRSDLDGAFRADYTYCTAIFKTPLVAALDGATADSSNAVLGKAGRLRMIDLGFFDPASAFLANVTTPPSSPTVGAPSSSLSSWVASPLLASDVPPRAVMTDKRAFGHVLIIAGSVGMPGAAIMAVLGAARSGVGLLTVCAPESVCRVGQGTVPEGMWVALPLESDTGAARVVATDGCGGTNAAMDNNTRANSAFGAAALEVIARTMSAPAHFDAVIIGPGMGCAPSTTAFIRGAIECACRPQREAHAALPPRRTTVVIDADALQADVMSFLMSRAATNHADSRAVAVSFVLTPHAGELARCCAALPPPGTTVTTVAPATSSFLSGAAAAAAAPTCTSDAARLASATRSIVVEKGPRTWVWGGCADHGGPQVLIPAGGPTLARGGSGDVLAGLVAGSCAAVTALKFRSSSGIGGGGGAGAGAAAAAAAPRAAAAAADDDVLLAVVRAALRHGMAADAAARAGGEESYRTTDMVGVL